MKAAPCLLCFVVFMCECHVISSYKSGAPPSACVDMFPEGHRVDSQNRTPPYVILVSSTVYQNEWELITVKVNALDGYYIAGLLLQARRSNCSDPGPVGIFDLSKADSSTVQKFKTMECMERKDSAITHTRDTSSHPVRETVFSFFTPAANVGHFYFVATIVKTKDIFWTGVTSDVIRKHENNTPLMTCPMRTQYDPHNINTTPGPYATTKSPHSGSTYPHNRNTTPGPYATSVSLLFLATLLHLVYLS
ncbi:putative defense protein Hdd11-like isoform X1 [Dreissena polymorpha]|nr:putative defense protein Hdd11-like isoform X1 [Dreissena polymorpha]XP_052256768.1 putative defense protein Hdd11-like isoform X1 [Dreissena polymorpha]XP_052256769.1 putative defense protein Hdd11-like isoform X1 [Dreissena polymorpha]XP_052256770.1 putative defense protein Hdd11-like isoform X1 [Dreissena polymorpha]